MAERIVPEANVRATASPVDRFIAPVMRHPETNGVMEAAAALQSLNPSLQKFLSTRNAENAAVAEAEGAQAEQHLNAGFEFNQGRDNWRQAIADVRKRDPATAEKMAGANPHFRRGVIKARMNRLGMGLNDHLMNLWRQNPEVNGQGLHDIDDPAVISQWMQEQSTAYTDRYGIADMDPLLVQEVYSKRVSAAQDQMMSRHTEFRFARYNSDYLTEMSANTGLILAGAGNNASSIEGFMAKMGMSESNGDYTAKNDLGYTGKFQFGKARLADYNRANGTKHKLSEFTDTPEGRALQNKVMVWHVNDIDRVIAENNYLEGGFSLDGLRAVAHLGGIGGMKKFVATNGGYDPDDGYTKKNGTKVRGTKLSDYYNKFSGPAGELQENLNAAIADGMDPRKANRTIVESVVRSAIESGNPAVLQVLDSIDTGNGPLSNIGWVSDAVSGAEASIANATWKTEQRNHTLETQARERHKLAIQMESTRSLLIDPYGDIAELQRVAIDSGNPQLAEQMTTLQRTLINADQKVYVDDTTVTDLRMRISAGSIEQDELFAEITAGINAGLLDSASSTALLDDFDRGGAVQDLFRDAIVRSTVTDVGKVVSSRFAISDTFNTIPGTEKSVEAMQWLDRRISAYIFENPEATKTDVRDYADKQLEKMLKSPVWQPDERELDAERQRAYGDVSTLADTVGRLETEPATVIAEWLSTQADLTATQISQINMVALSSGMTAREFMELHAPQTQGP